MTDSLCDHGYCQGCGHSEYAGITHICPPIQSGWQPISAATRTVSTIPVYFNTGLATVTTGGETSA